MKKNVVGGQLVIFREGVPIYSQISGMADREKNIPVSADTKFRIASISKFITGIMAMQMDVSGILDIDKVISDYLGVKVRLPGFEDIPVTTRYLLSHNSGIGDGDGSFHKQSLNYVLKHLDKFANGHAPGTKYDYTNLGAGMVSAVMEGASKQHFVDYTRSFFSELGIEAAYVPDQMKNQSLPLQTQRGEKNTFNIHVGNATAAQCRNTPLGRFIAVSYGDLLISSIDLAKLAAAVAWDGTVNGEVLLPQETIDEMCTVQTAPRGLALKICPPGELAQGRTLYGHNGLAYGAVTSVYFDRTDGTGYVFLNNGCSEKNGTHTNAVTEEIAALVFDEYLKNE